MCTQFTTASPKLQGNLKRNFEAALVELHEEDPKASARHTPIVQRQQFKSCADPKKQALSVAAAALAALWGL
jgi:hypothetical protein